MASSCFRRKRAFAAKLQSLQSTPFFVYVQQEDFEMLAHSFTAHRFSKGQALPESPFYLVVRGELDIVLKGSPDILCTKHQGAFFSRNAGIVEVPTKPFSMRRSEGLANTMRHLKRFASLSGDRDFGLRPDKADVGRRSAPEFRVPTTTSSPSSEQTDKNEPTNRGSASPQPPPLPRQALAPDSKPAGGIGAGLPPSADRASARDRAPATAASPTVATSPTVTTITLMARPSPSPPQTTFKSSKVLCTEAKTNIVARSEGQVLLLSPSSLARLMARAGPQTNAGVRSMMMSNLEDLLVSVPFIRDAGLDKAAIRALGELCSYSAVEAGKEVFAQGAEGADFFMILHGAVSVRVDSKALALPRKAMALGVVNDSGRRSSEGATIPLETMVAGQYFGELALVAESARFASVATVERSLFLVVSKSNFHAFLGIAPALEGVIMQHAKARLLERFRVLRVPFIDGMPAEQIEQTAKLASVVHYSAGECICRQGEAGAAFYVVIDGEVRVMQVPNEGCVAGGVDSIRSNDGDPPGVPKLLEVMQQGRYFGEIAIMLGQDAKCTASCIANGSKCTLLALPRAAFYELFGRDTGRLAELHIRLMRQECALLHVLNHPLGRPLFEAKLKAEYAEEALLFYDQVGHYALQPEDERPAAAAAIVDEYIRPGAVHEINIPDAQRKCVLSNVEAAGADLFAHARKEAYNLMSRDTFRRFVREGEYQALVKELGGYKGSTSLAAMSLSNMKLEVV